MRRIANLLIFLITFFLLSAVFASNIRAAEFETGASVAYSFNKEGIATAEFDITITNLSSDLYAQSYQLAFENVSGSDFEVYENGQEADFEVTEENGGFSLVANFSDPAIGQGTSKEFQITFKVSDFAIKTGEIWEVRIPQLKNVDSFDHISVSLKVPTTFGRESYVYPEPNSSLTNGGYRQYSFDKEKMLETPINAGYGEFQIFSFSLNYHLQNTEGQAKSLTIPLPPDTTYQKVYYSKIEPVPDDIYRDTEGNWIAEYVLNKGERIDVIAAGNVRITQEPQLNFGLKPQEYDLKPTEFWQSDDPRIQQIASELTSANDIYDYVVSTLSYDFSRAKPGVQRASAVGALNSPGSAICMEFTDLFIALARAKGIPAREVNGYAYTENPEIQPLSLVNDVLHSWPEYYDESKKLWVPVDPTWGATTGGTDYFNKLDLRHFAFVVHSKDPSLPYPPGSYKLGENPQKDVFVNFGRAIDIEPEASQVDLNLSQLVPFTATKAHVTLTNTSQSAIYNKSFEVRYDGRPAETVTQDVLLPFTTVTHTIKVPVSFLGIKTPERISVYSGDILVGEIAGNKSLVILYNIISVFFVLGLVCLALYLGYKKYAHKQ